MSSKSFQKFENVLERVIAQIRLFDEINKSCFNAEIEDPLNGSDDLIELVKKIDFSEIVRSGIVLSVAAMDAYFTDVFIEHFTVYIKNKGCSKDLESILTKSNLSLGLALNLYSSQRPFRKMRSFLEKYLERYVTQDFKTIDNLFKCYGIKDLSINVQRKCKRKNMISKINCLLKRRHQIVHKADLNKHGKLIPINLTAYFYQFMDLNRFVETADQIIESAIGKNANIAH